MSRARISTAGRRAFLHYAAASALLPAWAGAQSLSARNETLIAAARKEGSLTLYSNMPPIDNKELLNAFQNRYRIPINLWRAASEEITQRTIAEARASRVGVDFVLNNAPAVEALRLENLLQVVETPAWEQLRPQAAPSHRAWAGFAFNLLAAARNTNLVPSSQLPKTYDDLLDPKWKGKLGIEADDSDWFGGLLDAMGEEKGLELFRAIAAKNGLSVRKGHSLLTNLVVSGEIPLALTVFTFTADVLRDNGAPIEWFALDPLVAMPNCISIIRTAPHPNAAALFFDYMLTDAQDILAKLHHLCANKRVPLPVDEARLHMLDPEHSSREGARWQQLYRSITLSR